MVGNKICVVVLHRPFNNWATLLALNIGVLEQSGNDEDIHHGFFRQCPTSSPADMSFLDAGFSTLKYFHHMFYSLFLAIPLVHL